MWAYPFNHRAAVAAAKAKAAELHSRARMLRLATLMTVENRGEMTEKLQQLQIRKRELEHFIQNPYPKNSLLHIGFERDRRAVLAGGMPLQGLGLA